MPASPMIKLLPRLPVLLHDWRYDLCNFRRYSKTGYSSSTRFRGNICGRPNRVAEASLTRELITCRCGSTVRIRALVNVLSEELFGVCYAIPDMPVRHDLVGVDMSGAATYAERLIKKTGYINTLLHKEPILDITGPENQWSAHCDFVISSDLFEHVATPVGRAFDGVFRMLKPGGVFVLTVPYTKVGATIEHFPELHEYRVEEREGKRILFNGTVDGRVQKFDDLIYHGGEGETLEMRVFLERDVIRELANAGFIDVRIRNESCKEFGILWQQDWSLPITVRRPK